MAPDREAVPFELKSIEPGPVPGFALDAPAQVG